MRAYNELFSEEVWGRVNQENKDLLSNFLLELKSKKRSPGTIVQYGYNLRGFMCYLFKYFDNKNILDLGKKDFRKYSIFLMDDCKISNARYNTLIACLHSILDYAEQDDDFNYENNLSRKVRGLPSDPVKEVVFLEDSTILSVYEKYMSEGKFQLASLLMLAYDSAGRRSELFQVTKQSFFLNRNNTNIVIGKGKKKFSLIYFSKTKEAVNLWLKERGDDGIESLWIPNLGAEDFKSSGIYNRFISMRKDIKLFCENSNEFTSHSMRHSSLTNYGNGTHYVCRELGISGFSIEKLKLIAHHHSTNTTQSYLPDNDTGELENMFGIKINT